MSGPQPHRRRAVGAVALATGFTLLIAGCSSVAGSGSPLFAGTSGTTASSAATAASTPAPTSTSGPVAPTGNLIPNNPSASHPTTLPAGSSATGSTTSYAAPTNTSAQQFPTATETSSAASVPDSQIGLKPNAPKPTITASGDQHTQYDLLAEDAVSDLIRYYSSIFPSTFGMKFVPPHAYESYDSTSSSAEVCGTSAAGEENAGYYFPPCDTIAWDRGALLPDETKVIGVLFTPTVLAHEMGHRVQTELGFDQQSNPTIVAEQQADCYAGSYWHWVAQGNSVYFNFNQGAGMREALASLLGVADPVGDDPTVGDSHGNGFDRTYAFALGYSQGAARCNKINLAEIQKRITENPFYQLPTDFGNIAITTAFLAQVVATVNSWFGQQSTSYKAPALAAYTSSPPACSGYTATAPVGYCPATNTVYYNLAELQKIGTPTNGYNSTSGDFSAVIELVSRYALAAVQAEGKPITGDAAGQLALCYAGTWATWMRNPQGSADLALSPNDLDKAIYQVIASTAAESDVNGATQTPVIQVVQALDTGVTTSFQQCTSSYSS